MTPKKISRQLIEINDAVAVSDKSDNDECPKYLTFSLPLLTDEEIEARITMCGLQMLAANKLGMKDERRRWLDEQALALHERASRPAMVARMEAERGLD